MRLIDADKVFISGIAPDNEYGKGYADGLKRAIKSINAAPTIEAAPVVHGRWVLVKPRRTGRNATYKCTACGQLRSSYYNDVAQWKHCPCGARMDGDGNG